MDVDASVATATSVEQGNIGANSFATDLPMPGAKRKRAGSYGNGDSASHGRLDTADQQKRRVMRLPSFGGVPAASREPQLPPGSHRARTVAMAITKVRRRIGKATRRRRRPGLSSLERRLSRISL